ncbi:MAG: branched-chain amino acid ABC transporter permease [Ruminococcus sp.]|nr:branched-chain amino acid ABC transporter permease [Ruminococcus sp.]
MPTTIDIPALAGWIGAVAVIGGVLFAIFRFIEQQKVNKAEIKAMKKELTLICYGLSACLDGLEQLHCNHTVPIAREKLSKHLNQAAHDEDE